MCIGWLRVGDWAAATSAAFALCQAVALAVHLQDVDVVGEAVEQGAGEPFAADDVMMPPILHYSREMGIQGLSRDWGDYAAFANVGCGWDMGLLIRLG